MDIILNTTFNNAYLPAGIYASDNFNRPNGALGSTPIGGKAWSILKDEPADTNWVVDIFNNQIRLRKPSATGTPATRVFALIDDGVANGQVLATLTQSGVISRATLALRVQDAQNMTYIGTSGTDWGIYTRIDGSPLKRAGGTVTPAVGQRLRVVLNGNSISLYVDGVLDIPPTTVSPFASATKKGFGHSSSTSAGTDSNGGMWDDFQHIAL